MIGTGKRVRIAILSAIAACFAGLSLTVNAQEIEVPKVVLQGVPFEVTVKDPDGMIVPGMGPVLSVDGQGISDRTGRRRGNRI